jgi:hypothetical protein
MIAATAITRSTRLMFLGYGGRDNGPVGYLYGEWPSANLFFGIVFLAAALGVTGIGYWVIRHDRRNRIGEEAEALDGGEHEHLSEAH